jgi:GT2 family glycosyltransferase
LIVNPSGKIEDSARRFPTPVGILRKLLPGSRNLDYEIHGTPVFPDWVGGMFMVFRSEIFHRVGGFDEGYFLYYEDVDLCWRLHGSGYRVVFVPSVRAIHDARRESHRQIRYLFWHARSMLRFFRKRCFGMAWRG